MAWEIAGKGEPIDVPWGTDLAAIWRWTLRSPTELAEVDVRIARSAQAMFGGGHLDERAWSAIRTAGRSEAERMVAASHVHRYVHVSTAGCVWSDERSVDAPAGPDQ